MTRLLIIPVALSGVCLSMLFGVPMADAMHLGQPLMEENISGQQERHFVEHDYQGSQPVCCASVQMEHDTQATAPNQGKMPVLFCVADMPQEGTAWKFKEPVSTWPPPNSLSLHQPFSLTGIIVKCE